MNESIKSGNPKYTSISIKKIIKSANRRLTSIPLKIEVTIFGGVDGYLPEGVMMGGEVISLTTG